MNKESRPHRMSGIVTGVGRMKNTITVTVNRLIWHPRVRKQIRSSRKYLVHDSSDSAQIGDIAIIEKCRPISKRKHYRLFEIRSKEKKK